MNRIGFIGAGNMAGAILRGICGQKVICPEQIGVYDRYPTQCERYAQMGCHAYDTLQALVENSETLVFCVKPQNLAELLDELVSFGGVGERLCVSIVTGKPAQVYFDALGEQTKLVLVMPNTPMLVGCGVSAVATGYHTTDEEYAFAKSLFTAAGVVGEVTPEQLSQMVAVSGSTPAFLYRYAKVVAEYAAESIGMDFDTALRMFAGTMIGSAKMLTESGMTPDELIRQVSSPGGTTLAGLAAMDASGHDASIIAALDAAVRRAEELKG